MESTYKRFIKDWEHEEITRVKYILSPSGFDNNFESIVSLLENSIKENEFAEITLHTHESMNGEDSWSEPKVIINLGGLSSPLMSYDEFYSFIAQEDKEGDMAYELSLKHSVIMHRVNIIYTDHYLNRVTSAERLREKKEEIKAELFG